MSESSTSVEGYIARFPKDVQVVLERIRQTIHATLPDAEESISYGMPTVTLDGRPVAYFAGWKHHVSLYPVPDLDAATETRLAPYRSGRGTARFPLDQPIPYELVARLVERLAAQRDPAHASRGGSAT